MRLALLASAMGFHSVAMDFGPRETQGGECGRSGRGVLVGALAAGSLTAVATPVSEVRIALFNAALAGAVILNVLKEELPAERRSRIAPLALGAAVHPLVLLAVSCAVTVAVPASGLPTSPGPGLTVNHPSPQHPRGWIARPASRS